MNIAIDFGSLADGFRDLDIREIGNWAVAPKVLALLALVSAIVGAGWWFDWSDQMDQITVLEQQEEKLKEEYVSKKRQAVNLDVYRKQLAEIDRSFGALLKQLPNRSEMEALLVDINQAGLGRGLQFELFKPSAEATREFYAEMPISIKVTGGYHDLGAFAADVARLPRIVTLNDIHIAAPKESKDTVLTMDATAKTFRYLDDAELEAQRKAAAKEQAEKSAKEGK